MSYYIAPNRTDTKPNCKWMVRDTSKADGPTPTEAIVAKDVELTYALDNEFDLGCRLVAHAKEVSKARPSLADAYHIEFAFAGLRWSCEDGTRVPVRGRLDQLIMLVDGTLYGVQHDVSHYAPGTFA